MKVTVEFNMAPGLAAWQSTLTPQGWKIVHYSESKLEATKEVGASEFPVRLATRWNLVIEENDPGATVALTVPAFSGSPYAKNRLLEKIATFANAVDGHCQTDQNLQLDLLSRLREQ